jgi:hypothetical protein
MEHVTQGLFFELLYDIYQETQTNQVGRSITLSSTIHFDLV